MYFVKWVSCKGRYTTLKFKTFEKASECAKRHEQYTGRPARVVFKDITGKDLVN